MDFNEQVKQAYINADEQKKLKTAAVIGGIIVSVGVVIFFVYLTATVMSRNSRLSSEYDAYYEKSQRQIKYLTSELSEVEGLFNDARGRLDKATIENIALREENKRIDVLQQELDQAYTEIDQSQEKIKTLTVANNDLLR